jgi:hypothetical protein
MFEVCRAESLERPVGHPPELRLGVRIDELTGRSTRLRMLTRAPEPTSTAAPSIAGTEAARSSASRTSSA